MPREVLLILAEQEVWTTDQISHPDGHFYISKFDPSGFKTTLPVLCANVFGLSQWFHQ